MSSCTEYYQNGTSNTNVVYVTEEANINIVLLIISWSIIVEFTGQTRLPTCRMNCNILILNLSEAS